MIISLKSFLLFETLFVWPNYFMEIREHITHIKEVYIYDCVAGMLILTQYLARAFYIIVW